MQTLPLYHHAVRNPDAWHNVTAPGGYEWWYFDAEDTENDRQLVAILFDGFVFHPGYLRRYFQFDRRPTCVKPPLPREYVCAYCVVYHGGKIEHQFMTQYPAEQFEARQETRHVQIGPNRFSAGDAREPLELFVSGTPWKLTGRGPQLQSQNSLMASLTFQPRFNHAPGEREFFSRQLAGAEHRWVIANPSCDVSGEITVSTAGAADLRILFRGRGYHDHNFGTGPIGPGIGQWFWGRVLMEDRCATFHFARPRDWKLEAEMHLIEVDSSGAHEIDVEKCEIDWSRRTATWLKYPDRANFQGVLRLENPRVIDSSPFYLRLIYDATLRGATAKAFCEVAYPHRLRWPVLGRMIEMSIDKRAMKQ